MKYLGLVIEKDEELDLDSDDEDLYDAFRSLNEERDAFRLGRRNLEQGSE